MLFEFLNDPKNASYSPPPPGTREPGGLIGNVLGSREREAAITGARNDFQPVAKAIAEQISSGDYMGAWNQLARQSIEIGTKHGEFAAGEVLRPTFKILAQAMDIPYGQAQGLPPSTAIEPGRGVKVTQAMQNMAAAGNQDQQTLFNRERAISESDLRIPKANWLNSQQGALDSRTQQLVPAQTDAARAAAERDRAAAAKDRTAAPGAAKSSQATSLIADFNKQLGQQQEFMRRLGTRPEDLLQQNQATVNAINQRFQQEGLPDRYGLAIQNRKVVLVPQGALQGQQPPREAVQAAAQGPEAAPSPAPQGATNLFGQGAGELRLGGAPPLPQTPQAEAPQQALPSPTPQAAPQQAGDVGDLSRLIPQALQSISQGQPTSALQVRAELAKQGITDQRQIDAILQSIAQRFGQTVPGR